MLQYINIVYCDSGFEDINPVRMFMVVDLLGAVLIKILSPLLTVNLYRQRVLSRNVYQMLYSYHL